MCWRFFNLKYEFSDGGILGHWGKWFDEVWFLSSTWWAVHSVSHTTWHLPSLDGLWWSAVRNTFSAWLPSPSLAERVWGYCSTASIFTVSFYIFLLKLSGKKKWLFSSRWIAHRQVFVSPTSIAIAISFILTVVHYFIYLFIHHPFVTVVFMFNAGTYLLSNKTKWNIQSELFL